ncbi:MAG: glycosyltransferase family 4 protein [Planctomycetota bacterium]
MHAALLANTAWLDDELAAFGQLSVGLVDEQVRLTRVVPEHFAGLGADGASLLGEKRTWAESRSAIVNHRRLVRMADALDASGVDLLHAMHRDLWQPAAVIGDQLDLPVVFQASSLGDAADAARLSKQINPTRCVFVATTEPIADELRRKTQNLVRIETVPPGVHVGDPKAHGRSPGESPCFAVCGDGVLDDAYVELLEGITRVVAERPELLFFMDGQKSDQHQLWKAARRMGLLGSLSFVPRKMGHRELLLMADAVVHPQTQGRSRGLTLMAMAHAVPVLAAADDALDYLVQDHTAWIVDQPDSESWAELFDRLASAPDAAADLGMRARAWVHDERLASDHIERTLTLYRSATGEPLPFPG